MIDFFSEEMRRDPFAAYDQMRRFSPTFHVPPPFDAWLVFDFQGVKRVLSDHDLFSSCVPAPKNWFIFFDPPAHSKLRALISKAFTPRMVSNLEPRIRSLSRQLINEFIGTGTADLATIYSAPLPMMVIAEMIGIPSADWPRFKVWSDQILLLSHTRSGTEKGAQALAAFRDVAVEMSAYLDRMIEQRRSEPRDDLLTRLIEAEVDGVHLTQEEILGFFQLLIVGGQETTTNLIDNAILCFIENRDQLALVHSSPELLPAAIEEVLRYRSPLQWMMRSPKRDVELNGKTIPAGKLVLPMMGSANRDPNQFPNPDKFDITRHPNQHIAFGHGIHFCLGAALARMEARIALSDLLIHLKNFDLAGSEPWKPREALQVHGPAHLEIQFKPGGHLPG
jgi:cytochrome P450